MADFIQTMKDWKRMCNAMERERPHDACCGCPLEGYGCPAIHEDNNSHMDFADVEKIVTAWAAEHPEPVYPTWVEYLVGIGVIPHEIRLETADALMDTHMLKPISADIAEKLEIEPKEG